MGVSSDDIATNQCTKPVAQPSPPTTSGVLKLSSNEKSLSTGISALKERSSTRTSPRYSRTDTIIDDLKEADHSMLGTIKARRAINGRNVFQENFFSLPNTRSVRSESQGNNSSSLSVSLFGNNRMKSTDSNTPPIFKKRKLT